MIITLWYVISNHATPFHTLWAMCDPEVALLGSSVGPHVPWKSDPSI